jgi:hypothetical protein
MLASLFDYYALRAVRVAELGPSWRVRRLYATDLDGESDALWLWHDSGGYFVQAWSTNQLGLPRAQTILEFLRSLEPLPAAAHKH